MPTPASPPLSPSAGLRLLDDIVAPATPPGPGVRAILRLTGPTAWNRVGKLLDSPDALRPGRFDVQLRLPDFHSALPVHLQLGRGPRTYTGQDLVEIHFLSSPPLIQTLLDTLREGGVRLAQPGEFTLRAFLAGKLDLTQAEAVLALTTTDDLDELRTALAQLAGGLARPLDRLREEILLLLAEVEAGLDFADEDLSFLAPAELARRIAATADTLADLRRHLDDRAATRAAYRVVLAGLPNAGKSSLFNALLDQPRALVSPQPGTTRDYLTGTIHLEGIAIELIDTAGREDGPDTITRQVQAARAEQLRHADLVLHCFDATVGPEDVPPERTLLVATKCDLPHHAIHHCVAIQTSTLTGVGLPALRSALANRARATLRPAAVAPSLTRCRAHLDRAHHALGQAASLAMQAHHPELAAAELRLALDEIGIMVGAVYTEDLLDRVFSRFCIGK